MSLVRLNAPVYLTGPHAQSDRHWTPWAVAKQRLLTDHCDDVMLDPSGEYLGQSLGQLSAAGCVVAMSGWARDRIALIEVGAATQMGIPVWEWYEHRPQPLEGPIAINVRMQAELFHDRNGVLRPADARVR